MEERVKNKFSTRQVCDCAACTNIASCIEGGAEMRESMRNKKISILLSAAIACSTIFAGCTNEDAVPSEKTAENNPEAISKKETADNSEDTAKDTADTIDEEESLDQNKDDRYHPGDVVSFDGFKITYKSIQKYKSDNRFLQPKKGFQYIQYKFSFENTGEEDSYIGSFSCYANGEQCESSYVDDSDGDLLLTKLSTGRKKSGTLLYEVPKNIKLKDLELEYEANSLWSDEKIIFLGD